jgi:hypothetical protein
VQGVILWFLIMTPPPGLTAGVELSRKSERTGIARSGKVRLICINDSTAEAGSIGLVVVRALSGAKIWPSGSPATWETRSPSSEWAALYQARHMSKSSSMTKA